MTALAAKFFQQAHAFDDHAAIHGLAHVVDGQRSDAGSGQRFHLDTSLPGQLAGSANQYAVFTIRLQLDLDAGEQQRMTQRDQFVGLFRCLYTGNARDGERESRGCKR